MTPSRFSAVKLATRDLAACETFFTDVFGFQVTHRYGGAAGDAFEEIVMTLRGEQGPMLKFIQASDRPAAASGATIQIVLDDLDAAIAAATRAGATVAMPPTDFPEAGVAMGVITTDQGLDIELVRAL